MSTCQYFVREPGQSQRPCGEPATHRYANAAGWFEVCHLHARVAQEAVEKQGKRLSVSRIEVEARG